MSNNMDLESKSTCAICLDDLDSQDVSLMCGHMYHASCLLMCLLKIPAVQWQCPLCRDKILKRCVNASVEKKASGISKWQSMHSLLKCACLALKNRGQLKDIGAVDIWDVGWRQLDIRLPFWATSSLLNFIFRRAPESFDDVCTTVCARNHILCMLNMRRSSASILIMRHMIALLSSMSVFFFGIAIVQWSTNYDTMVVCPLARKIVTSLFYPTQRLSRISSIDFSLRTHVYCGDTGQIFSPAACFTFLGCLIMMQFKVLFNASIYEMLHNWTSYYWKANIFWIGLAILYSFASFLFRTLFMMRFIMRLLGTCISLPPGGREICFSA